MDTDEDQVTSFQSLTPGKKFRLVKTLGVNPQNTMYNRDGSLAIQITKDEATTILPVTKIDNFKVDIAKHEFKNYVRGVISNDIIRLSPEQEIKDGLTQDNCVKVVKKHRPSRDNQDNIIRDKQNKVVLEPSPKATITIESETLPEYVNLFGVNIPVKQFEPEPYQCNRCYNFGQCIKWENGKRENNCKQVVEICGWCAEKSHKERNEKCTKKAKCVNCDSEHPSFSKDCPAYKREKRILLIKEIDKVPYPRAREIVEKERNKILRKNQTYSKSCDTNQINHTKNNDFKELQTEVKELTNKLNCLCSLLVTQIKMSGLPIPSEAKTFLHIDEQITNDNVLPRPTFDMTLSRQTTKYQQECLNDFTVDCVPVNAHTNDTRSSSKPNASDASQNEPMDINTTKSATKRVYSQTTNSTVQHPEEQAEHEEKFRRGEHRGNNNPPAQFQRALNRQDPNHKNKPNKPG